MSHLSAPRSRQALTSCVITLGIFALFLTAVFYQDLRRTVQYPVAVHWYIPTFFHVVLFSLLSVSLAGSGQRARWSIPLFWTVVNLIVEGLQIIPFDPFRGRFDWGDMGAAVLGGGVAAAVIPLVRWPGFRRGAFLASLTLGLSTIAATQCGERADVPDEAIATVPAEPLYMSYEDLRASFAVEAVPVIKQSTHVLAAGTLLLVNELNAGIYVVDNQDPTQPAPKSFLRIPGNVDMAVKDGILYADSYVDLLVIDIRDPDAIKLLRREENVFPYNPYQAIYERRLFFRESDIVKEKGVIVGAIEEQTP